MKTIYRVMMMKDGKWEPFTNYHDYQDAELAARGLITGGSATQVHILEIGAGGGRIVAKVSATPKAGWPHGAAVVQKEGRKGELQ